MLWFVSVPGKRKQAEGNKVPLWGHKAFLLSFPIPFGTALAICLWCSRPLWGGQERRPILCALVWKVGQGRLRYSLLVVNLFCRSYPSGHVMIQSE